MNEEWMTGWMDGSNTGKRKKWLLTYLFKTLFHIRE
jgi:hypothetical protein